MNIKSNIGLIFKFSISLVFAFYVGFEIYKSIHEEDVADTKMKFFLNLTDDMSAIQLFAGTTHIKLKKESSGWWIEEPIKDKAKQDWIENWIHSLKESYTVSIPEQLESVDLIKFGLNDPLAKIEFFKKGVRAFEIKVSPTKTYNGQNYLSYTDAKIKNKILISSLPWFDFILKQPIDFLSTEEVLSFDPISLQKLEFRNHSPQPATDENPYQALTSGVFSKQNDLWSFSAKQGADGAKVLALLEQLKAVVKYGFEADTVSFKKNKNVKPIFEIDLDFKNKAKEKITVYNFFRPCLNEDPEKNCQLVVLSSKTYPLWVSPSSMVEILNLGFLKK